LTKYDDDYFDGYEAWISKQAKADFWVYRQYINPKLKLGWFQKEIAHALQEFYEAIEMHESPWLLIEAPPQHGKQIADETPILTKSGWKNHGELTTSDSVIHISGEYSKVLNITEKTESTIKVSFSNGEEIFCHPNHEWTVYNRNKKRIETIETKDLLNARLVTNQGKRSSRYYYKLPQIKPMIGSEIELQIHPYFLGVWLGDGSRSKPCITGDKKDLCIIEHIEQLGYKKSAQWIHKDTGVYTTSFSNIGVIQKLKSLGICSEQKKWVDKRIPEVYFNSSIEQRLQLLAGLIDTDGYLYQKTNRYVFTTAEINLAKDFCKLISTLGMNYSFVTEQPKLSSSGIQGKKEYYVIGFNPTVFVPCILERKRNLRVSRNKMIAITKVVEGNFSKVGHCITIEHEDGLYLVGEKMIPTHNSSQIIDFLSWLSGKRPDLKTIYTSYSERLGVRANRKMQRILDSDKFQKVFPETKLNSTNNVTISNKYQRNMNLLEFVGADGYFRNTTIGGAITGESLDIGIIDDAVKGREQAESETIRNKIWEWFTDDFLTRFSEGGALLGIGTRWHVDDPFGRIRDRYKNIKVLSFKAISEQDEKHRKANEALFPELKSLEYLQKMQSLLHPTSWNSLFQQNPILKTGNYFTHPNRAPWEKLIEVRAWIDPGFDGDNRTALGILGKTRDGKTILKGFTWRKNIINLYPEIIQLLKDNKVGTVYVETNADQGRSCDDIQRLWPATQGRRSDKNKHIKILTRLVQYWGQIFVAEDCNPEFLNRVMLYKEGVDDDEADSLASLLDEIGIGANPLLERFR
jgi:hypothetical protein